MLQTMELPFSSSRRGDIAEHVATAYLLHRGYEVFNNSCCTGPLDIIAIDAEKRVRRFDVKRCSDNKGVIYLHKSVHDKEKFKEYEGELLFIHIADNFDVTVSDSEDEFLTVLRSKGYRVGHNGQPDQRRTYCFSREGEDSVYEATGLKACAELTGFNQGKLHRLIYDCQAIDGWRFIGKTSSNGETLH
ncbi:hypothetical protein VAA96_004533 [Salmonella enterica]|nr:hypothetical protein [Salmonella enterica]